MWVFFVVLLPLVAVAKYTSTPQRSIYCQLEGIRLVTKLSGGQIKIAGIRHEKFLQNHFYLHKKWWWVFEQSYSAAGGTSNPSPTDRPTDQDWSDEKRHSLLDDLAGDNPVFVHTHFSLLPFSTSLRQCECIFFFLLLMKLNLISVLRLGAGKNVRSCRIFHNEIYLVFFFFSR